MTTITAQYGNKNDSTAAGKIGSVLRNFVVSYVKAHELQAESMVAARATEQRVEGAAELNRLANKMESIHPSLATELRFIASRG